MIGARLYIRLRSSAAVISPTALSADAYSNCINGIGQLQPIGQTTVMIVEIWHGTHQRVGHLGSAQAHFNVLGQVDNHSALSELYYCLNGGEKTSIAIGRAPNGFGDGRRLARSGHFNADIPTSLLHDGENHIDIVAIDHDGNECASSAIIEKSTGSTPLPCHIEWNAIHNPQDVGQFVDGCWEISSAGLRTQHTGYKRLFLIGCDAWEDYQITVPITIHAVDPLLGPHSGDNGLGVIMRFDGHVEDSAPEQPSWSYRPFGAVAWLCWKDGPDMPPQKQFYRADSNERKNFGEFPIIEGKTYVLRAACVDAGNGVSTYRCAVWEAGEYAPDSWDWQVRLPDGRTPSRGGVALVAHHVNASFGDVKVHPL